MVPTKNPHILLDFAEAHGKQHEMQEALFKAYFSDGRDVSSSDILKELAGEVGLDQDKAIAALTDKTYIKKFEEGIKQTKIKGLVLRKHCVFYALCGPIIDPLFELFSLFFWCV